MSQYCCIVVGAGGISGAWFPGLKAEGVQVAAVVDLRREAAEGRIKEFDLAGAVAETDVDRALKDHKADFLVDLSPPEVHATVACKAMEARLHVIGEKPMAASMAEARRMIATSEKTGKLHMVSQSRRWDRFHVAMRQAVAGGQAGEVTGLHCDFFIGAHFGGFRDQMDSPLILDMAIHHFDLARFFAGGDAVSVYAEEFNPAGSWYRGDAAAHCLFEMAGGVKFTYRGSWCAEGCHTGWNGDWRIIGQKGSLVYWGDGNIKGDRITADEGFHRPTAPMDIPVNDLPASGMHGALREMLTYLRTGQLPQTECHANINSLAMVCAAIKSSSEKRRVAISEM